jgi:hypothetical protein
MGIFSPIVFCISARILNFCIPFLIFSIQKIRYYWDSLWCLYFLPIILTFVTKWGALFLKKLLGDQVISCYCSSKFTIFMSFVFEIFISLLPLNCFCLFPRFGVNQPFPDFSLSQSAVFLCAPFSNPKHPLLL